MAYRTINPFTEELVKETAYARADRGGALGVGHPVPTSSGGIAKPRMPDKQWRSAIVTLKRPT